MLDLLFVFSSHDLVMAAGSVMAYLDPSTGSYALQIVLAMLFGGMFALRQSWTGLKARVTSILGGRLGRTTSTNARPGIHGQPTAEIR